jgi:hypothetical protein
MLNSPPSHPTPKLQSRDASFLSFIRLIQKSAQMCICSISSFKSSPVYSSTRVAPLM